MSSAGATAQPTEKELPQPQDEAALGFFTWKDGAHHVLDEIDLGALDQLERDRVDHQLDAVALEDQIVVLALRRRS